MPSELLQQLRDQAATELQVHILPFWLREAVDREKGGFWARISNDLQIRARSPKGLILNTRILWTFSAAYRQLGNPEYLEIAHRAYHYLVSRFVDKVHGGMYWMLDADGKPMDTSKKIYGQAFAVYALTEYFLATGSADALRLARKVYELVETYNFDCVYGGYLETSNRDWSPTENLRLSDVDMNEKKSMNTHLHLLEAYIQLYRAWPDAGLRGKLAALVENFTQHIIDPRTRHLRLFFDETWHCKSRKISFGHDIETSWLLDEAVRLLDDPLLGKTIRDVSLQMVDAVLQEGVAPDSGVHYERDEIGDLDLEVHWWVQVEAVVGFLNAYQKSDREVYLEAAHRAWKFIMTYLVDRKYGEWFYKVKADRTPAMEMFKVSEWKCPYHSGRACLEIMRRIES